MKPTKLAIIVVLLLGLTVITGERAFSNMQVPEGNPIDALCNPKAHGTKLFGTLTINYNVDSNISDLHFFLRLGLGKELYGYSGTAVNVDISSPTAMKSAIDAFICQQVLPTLFNYSFTTPEACNAVYQLKSADAYVKDEPFHFPYNVPCESCVQLPFVMMDIVLAIK